METGGGAKALQCTGRQVGPDKTGQGDTETWNRGEGQRLKTGRTEVKEVKEKGEG